MRLMGILTFALGIGGVALALAHGSGSAGTGLGWILVWAVVITLVIVGFLVIIWSFDRAG